MDFACLTWLPTTMRTRDPRFGDDLRRATPYVEIIAARWRRVRRCFAGSPLKAQDQNLIAQAFASVDEGMACQLAVHAPRIASSSARNASI